MIGFIIGFVLGGWFGFGLAAVLVMAREQKKLVHCKDCKWAWEHGEPTEDSNGEIFCHLDDVPTPPNGFCHYGKPGTKR